MTTEKLNEDIPGLAEALNRICSDALYHTGSFGTQDDYEQRKRDCEAARAYMAGQKGPTAAEYIEWLSARFGCKHPGVLAFALYPLKGDARALLPQAAQEVKPGAAFIYTNSPALGLVHYVGVNPHTGSIVVTNSEAPDKHLREVASFDALRRCPGEDIDPKTFDGYLLKTAAPTNDKESA
jgi:hypothetical protein